MEAYSSSPLVADHLPKNHPVVTRDYSLFTPAISEMVNTVARWIDDQVDGATVATAVHKASSEAAARTFSPVPAF